MADKIDKTTEIIDKFKALLGEESSKLVQRPN